VQGALLGNYRIVEQLGKGGMGIVYVGRHEALGHRVAVKVLKTELSSHADVVQRFFNEAQATTAIRNPGIVQVFDFGTTPDGNAYFVMELLEGETLAARIKQRRHDSGECCRFGRQVANVLQAAHAVGITHRDLKPDNLFLVSDAEVIGGERVKVLDFGIAKLAGEVGVKTRTGLVMGTPKYMSPEQCRSANSVDARSDVYALGCIFFEMLCGRPPFVDGGLGDIVAGHLHSPPPNPQDLAPDISVELSTLIVTMLAKQPNARPQTMNAVSQTLDAILRTIDGSPVRTSTPVPGAHPTPPPGRTPTPVSGAHPTPPPGRILTPVPGLSPTPPPVYTPTPVPGFSPTPPGFSPTPPGFSPTPPGFSPTPPPMYTPTPPAHMPTPVPVPPPMPATPHGWTGMDSIQPHATNRRLYVLGGLVIIAAVVAIAIVLATDHPGSTERLVSYDHIAASSRPPGSAAVAATPTLAPRPTPVIIDAAVKTAPRTAAAKLEAECRGYQVDRKWGELAQCADKLKPLDPKRAAELRTRATEEARSSPRVAGVAAALQDKNLKQAKAELDQVWTESVEYAKIKSAYDTAEAQAIDDLVARLGRVKDASCEAYNQLLAKERAVNPASVTTEAARRSPCASAPR
jgi:serine/threonine protein kinase